MEILETIVNIFSSILGYVENKKIRTNLERILKEIKTNAHSYENRQKKFENAFNEFLEYYKSESEQYKKENKELKKDIREIKIGVSKLNECYGVKNKTLFVFYSIALAVTSFLIGRGCGYSKLEEKIDDLRKSKKSLIQNADRDYLGYLSSEDEFDYIHSQEFIDDVIKNFQKDSSNESCSDLCCERNWVRYRKNETEDLDNDYLKEGSESAKTFKLDVERFFNSDNSSDNYLSYMRIGNLDELI